MRVINDRNEKRESSEQLDFLSVFVHGIIVMFGFLVAPLCPFSMIGSHARTVEPWPKVIALSGALAAAFIFEIPALRIVALFIFSLFVADAVWRGTKLPQLLLSASAVALGILAFAFVYKAQLNGQGIVECAKIEIQRLSELTSDYRKSLQMSPTAATDIVRDQIMSWGFWKYLYVAVLSSIVSDNSQLIRRELIVDGSSLYLAFMLFSLLVSIGLASYLKWFPEKHTYSAPELRRFRFPMALSICFVAIVVGSEFVAAKNQYLFDAVKLFVGVLMFFQGMCLLSTLLSKGLVQPWIRAVLYAIGSLPPGIGVMVLVGVVTPWLSRRVNRLEEIK